jgi:PiT family inorganic phosphate transporter
MILFFLSSGLFLGWSLGANDAANVFGTAVGTRMIKFKTAAIIASVCLVLGAVLEGAGATKILGELGAIDTLPGSFAVAFAAGFTVTIMTRLRLPVSTSQAIVGAIIGWNLFSGSPTNLTSLTKIFLTWVLCPVISAFFAMLLYWLTKYILENSKIHLLTMDAITRLALIIVGAFGAYSLGANNIANVMGVFVPSSPFQDLSLGNIVHISSIQQLFFLGAVAISIGVFTYSYKVMHTVGKDLFRLSPVTAFIVVLSHSLVLYLFASQNLRNWLLSNNLPALPLVPVSSSQAVIGAILGIALAKGGRNIQWNILGRISSGWVTTPIIAGFISFMTLFFVQNVFDQHVYHETVYSFPEVVIERLQEEDIDGDYLEFLSGMEFGNIRRLNRYMNEIGLREKEIQAKVRYFSALKEMEISKLLLRQMDTEMFSPRQLQTLNSLQGSVFLFEWELIEQLAALSAEWHYREDTEENLAHNRELKRQFDYLIETFRIRKR